MHRIVYTNDASYGASNDYVRLHNVPCTHAANDVPEAISGFSHLMDSRYFGRLNLASK